MEKSHVRGLNNFASRLLIVLSAITVIVGGMIYVLFRPAEPIFFEWVTAIGSENWLSELRDGSLYFGNHLPQWVIYSLPSGLWAFGYTAFIWSTWTGSRSVIRFFWFGTIPLLVFGFELLQLTGAIAGTFCISDMIWSAIGITTGLTTVQIVMRRKLLIIRESHSNKDNAQLYLEST